MSEYMFGVHRGKLSAAECDRRDRICREEGGYGYTQIYEPTKTWLGWFSGPNRGAPFDSDFARRVMVRVTQSREYISTHSEHGYDRD